MPSIATILSKVTVWTSVYGSTCYLRLYGPGSNDNAPQVFGGGWAMAPFYPQMTPASNTMHVRANSELLQVTNQELAYADRE